MFIFSLIILLFSIVIHEVAHGAVADSLGDSTARNAGRLTLNPLKHLDPIGSLLVPFFLKISNSPFVFGWAKPVPVNPYNFKDQKYGQLKVAIAGPGSNLILALIFGIGARLLPLQLAIKKQIFASQFISEINFGLEDFFSKIFFIFIFVVFINVLLAIFNLIPIPPLDGSHVLFTFFPKLEHKTQVLMSKIGLAFIPLVFLITIFIFPSIMNFIIFLTRIFIGV